MPSYRLTGRAIPDATPEPGDDSEPNPPGPPDHPYGPAQATAPPRGRWLGWGRG